MSSTDVTTPSVNSVSSTEQVDIRGKANENGDQDADHMETDAEGETYETPGGQEADGDSHTPKLEEQDNEVVLTAARRLRGLMVEVLQDLQRHAPTRLAADIKITIGDRRVFDLTVGNAAQDEDRLVVKINPSASPPSATTAPSASESRKRLAEPTEMIDLTTTKRPRENGASSPAQPSPPSRAADLASAARQKQPSTQAIALDSPPADTGSEHDPAEPEYMRNEFKLLAKRVQWVEQCRRAAAAEYHAREEKWRITSASFHDENRIKRERHETWVAAELARQVNMLGQLLVDVRGLYPVLRSGPNAGAPVAGAPLRTPQPGQQMRPAPPPAPPPPLPEPVGVAYDTPASFSTPFMRRAELHRAANEPTRGTSPGRPRGRARNRGGEIMERRGEWAARLGR